MIEPTDDWLAAAEFSRSARRPGTKGRNVRIPDDLWEAFKALAESKGTTASAEVVAFVARYVKRHQVGTVPTTGEIATGVTTR